MPRRGQSTNSSEIATIDLSGSLTVRTAKTIHDVVLAGFQNPGPLQLQITDVSEVDLSFVQIVEAARRSAAAAAREIRLTHPADGALRDALQLGGFLAADDADRLAFWTQAKAA